MSQLLLPWKHLSDKLIPSNNKLKVVLNNFPNYQDKVIGTLFLGKNNYAVPDPQKLLTSELSLSLREKFCIDVFINATASSVRQFSYVLTPMQVCQLLSLASDISIEIEKYGMLVPANHSAKISSFIDEDSEGNKGICFFAQDEKGVKINNPKIVGIKQALLIDKQLRLYNMNPPMLPQEVDYLLSSSSLPLFTFNSTQADRSYQAIVDIGVNLNSLRSVAILPKNKAKILLRALLTTNPANNMPSLRMHLITEINHNDIVEEVEIPAKGYLPPIFCTTNDEGEQNKESAQLILRPSKEEEKARKSLMKLGAFASSQHHGFYCDDQEALDLLSRLHSGKGLPDFVHLELDNLPNIIQLPEVPTIKVDYVNEQDPNMLKVHFDVSDDLANLGVKFSDLLHYADKNEHTILINDETLLTFSLQSAQSFAYLSETMELPSAHDNRHIGMVELALLLNVLKNKVSIKADDAICQRLQNFTKFQDQHGCTVPASLLSTLRPYQREAFHWLYYLDSIGLGRLLADDMGLGKTLMILALLAKIKENHQEQKPSLVVAPTSVIDVWKGEALKHVKNMRVTKWHGSDRNEVKHKLLESDLVITSYALLRRDVDSSLSKIKFRYLIFDEAQYLKNPKTESWKSARKIISEQKIALSGTPIENRVGDLWSIIELVSPGVLGTERAFHCRYGIPIGKGSMAKLEELKKRIQPIMLRRKKSEVESELPPKIENIMHCKMQDKQKELYSQVLLNIEDNLKYSDTSSGKDKMSLLAALTRLRQVCCDPKLVEDNDSEEISAKGKLLLNVVKECLSMGRKIIIFSQFVSMQKIIHEYLKTIGVTDALWLHGATKNRAEVVEKFQSEDGPSIIVVSLKAGGTGLTLTAADTVIFYDPWWNPAVEDQATDRAHRIGQKKTVHVIRLICQDSIEGQMLKLSKEKRVAAEGVLSTGKASNKSLTMDEIKNLLAVEINRDKHIKEDIK